MITDKELVKILRAECKSAGSQRNWALGYKLSPAYICDVLQGRREPGYSILRAMGYRRIVGYEKIK